MTIVIVVLNLKGGAQKTTTSGYLLKAFEESGMSPMGIDSDNENQSLAGWQADADLPFPVISLTQHNIHQLLPGYVSGKHGVAVIDTPPMQAQKGTVASAVRAADIALITLAPTPIDYDRVAAVRQLVEEVGPLRPSGKPPRLAVLLTKCPGYPAKSPKVWRDQLTADGLHVLKAQVGRSEQFAQAFGSRIDHALRSVYGDVASELLDLVDQEED
ncbi:MAG: ParA family protein [Umezawaea sp.]